MPVKISLETISKLENEIAEIRCRALDTIEAKIRDARPNLDDLQVKPSKLIKSLMNYLRCEPLRDEHRILNILLNILHSKYRLEAKQLLTMEKYRKDFNWLQSNLSELAPSKHSLNEIFDILNENDENVDTATQAHSFTFTNAWETPLARDLNSMKNLKTSLQTDVDRANLDHALQYFEASVNDFPGEYFLQSPYIFASLLHLMEANEAKVNKSYLLNCCLQLTKNLERRVTVRRLSRTYYCKRASTTATPIKQVTIGSYCYEMFRAVLSYLQEIYATTELENINYCFLVLVEVIELICTTAVTYTHAVAIEYRIDAILHELGDFLKFIRESSDNYSRNPHKIIRNNSISILYLLCRLLMFKENGTAGNEMDSICAKTKGVSIKENKTAGSELDSIYAKMKDMLIADGRHREYDAKLFASFNRSHDTTGASLNQTNTDSFFSALNETIDHKNQTSASKAIWIRELEIALLDFALKDFYPEVHNLIGLALMLDTYKSTNQIKVLLKISESFDAAVKLLKEPKQCTDEMYVREGLTMIDVLPMLQCDELVQNLFNAISNLSSQFDCNEPLRTDAENLLLRLFGHECVQLKRLIYRLTAERMSSHFACIMDGKTMVSKSYSVRIGRSSYFGLPLTTEILIEIICGGLTAATDFREHAEHILTLVLRSREVMPQHWNSIREFLEPTLPLLQCFTTKLNTLGQLILEMSEPNDENHLSALRLFQSNVVLLFSRDRNNREEAVYRVSYLLQNNELAAHYLPNINYLNDVIPDNVCVVDAFVNPEWINFTDLYEATYVQPMIDLLNSTDVEPAIRHTTLIQLNVMLQDVTVAQHFYEANGMQTILRIFDESLRNDLSDLNYADNVIPIVGILAKLCMRLASARYRLSNDLQLYILLLRALLLFLDNVTLKTDCAIVLFSMAFSEYMIGGGGQVSNNDSTNGKHPAPMVSIPAICKKLRVPLQCEYHRLQSTSEARSAIEMLLLTPVEPKRSSSSSSSAICIESAYDQSVFWRFVRMCFASSWFGSLNNLSECDDKNSTIAVNYFHKNGRRPIAFNMKLCLTRNDVDVIKCTSPLNGINHWLHVLRNVTTGEQLSMSCAAIENFSNVDSVNRKQWDASAFLNAIRRFCSIMPQDESDELMYRQVQRVLSNLIERDFRDVHIWVLREFQRKNCLFLQMLSTSSSVTAEMFTSNTKFLEVVLTKTFQLHAKKSIEHLLHGSLDTNQKNASTAPNLYEKLFTMTTSQLDDEFNEKNIAKLRSVVSLLRLITSSVHIVVDDYTVSHLVNKLLKFIQTFTPYAQTGSQFNKNCLLTIGNLMIKIEQLKVESKYMKLLSNLCGHRDYEVRAYAWSILTKLSTTLNGAEQMINEMANLPGGFHACCLSTLLDDSEPAIVRENAAYVFSTLISYRMDNGHLHPHVLPMYLEGGEQMRMENHLDMLLQHHKLFKYIAESLEHFHAGETIIGVGMRDGGSDRLTSCDLLRSFCVIMCNLLTLKSIACVDSVILTMVKIITVIPQVTKSINKSSVLLLTEICTLVVHCMHQKRTLIDRVAQEFHIVSALISVLDIDLFEKIPNPVKHECWSEVLTVLKWLSRSSIGFQAICDSLSQNIDYLGNTFNVFVYGLSHKDTRLPVLRILTNLLVMSQSDEFKFKTFADLLNGLEINEELELSANRLVTDGKIISQSIVNLIAESNDEEERFAVDILYRLLVRLFGQYPTLDGKIHENVCKTLEALLKCSIRIRSVATDEKFLLKIVEQMGIVADSVGGSWTEYIRRHGNVKIERHATKIKLLFNMVISWYSCDCLEDAECIQSLVKMCIRLRPCLVFNSDTQSRFMKMLLFLSDDSLPVCKSMASVSISLGGIGIQNMLHTIIDYCVSETKKPKTPVADLSIIELGLRIVSNCCSCVEGRLLINKANMLQTMDRLHPQVTRSQKPWPQVAFYWLRFYEILTRYTEPHSIPKHLNLLRTFVDGNVPHLRQLALQILRNMSFDVRNRSALLTSDDFNYVAYTVLDNGTQYEQLMIVTSIWKLIAQNFKGKNTIKNSKIFNRLQKLQNKLEAMFSARSNAVVGPKRGENEENGQLIEEIFDELSIAVNHTMGILHA